MKRTFPRLCATMFACTGILYSGAAQSTVNILYCFRGGNDGTTPYAGMIHVNGILYGTTTQGGTGKCYYLDNPVGCGTLFSFDPATSKETVLYSFQSGTDGQLPAAHLVSYNGLLYGTTSVGGTGSCWNGMWSGCGTVFSYDLSSGVETVLYSFQGSDGYYPYSAVVPPTSGGNDLYGTTAQGGTGSCGGNGCGVVFKVNISTGAVTVVHSFQNDGKDGTYPGAGDLVRYNGRLYGTTSAGGAYGYGDGTIYSIDVKTGSERVVYSFGNGSDGSMPNAGMTNLANVLYGTTFVGGAKGYGTVYSYNPSSGTENVLFSFTGSDGRNPTTDLVRRKDLLYGATADPDVFSVNPQTGAEKTYGYIGGSDDPFENTRLTYIGGTLYGVATQNESCNFYGAIYSVTP